MQLAGGDVLGMVAMFTYEFQQALDSFREEGLELITLTNYKAMMQAAISSGRIKEDDVATFELWHDDPENWTPRSLELD